MSAPEKKIVMGRVAVPYGVKGWVKIQPFTEAVDGLLDYPEWWMFGRNGWQLCDVEDVALHGKSVIAKFAGVNDRTAAFALKGCEIAVPREDLPETGEDEYYWSDLVGLAVDNLQQQSYGTVKEVFATGANDVLVVQNEDRERLIPFTDAVVRLVDLKAGKMQVDWDADF